MFFNAETSEEIIRFQEVKSEFEINNLSQKKEYHIYMKVLYNDGEFSKKSNIVSFTTKSLGTLDVTYAQGYSYDDYQSKNVTSKVKEYLFDGIKTKQGGYGAYLMLNQAHAYMTFNIKDGDMYITFCSNSYTDSGGSSGATANFYKLNSNNQYELYKSIQQKNNNQAYAKTYFEEGSYKVLYSNNYVEFDEWIISEI